MSSDQDRGGLLSREDIAEAFDGARAPNYEVMCQECDANDDGNVSVQGFCACCVGSIRDPTANGGQ